MTATTADLKHREGPGLQATIQRVGGFLAGMIMPNISAFIAWGLITALFIPTGWWPNEQLAALVGPMITDAAAGPDRLHRRTPGPRPAWRGHRRRGDDGRRGRDRHPDVPRGDDHRPAGGVPPQAASTASCSERIRAGFEMLVDNFSAGILGVVMAILGLLAIGPIVETLANCGRQRRRRPRRRGPAAARVDHRRAGQGPVPEQRDQSRRPRRRSASPQAVETGKSILFMIETNPGPGLGILLAYLVLRSARPAADAPRSDHHPLLRRHPRDLLPVRADEPAADPRGHRRRRGRRRHRGRRPVRVSSPPPPPAASSPTWR